MVAVAATCDAVHHDHPSNICSISAPSWSKITRYLFFITVVDWTHGRRSNGTKYVECCSRSEIIQKPQPSSYVARLNTTLRVRARMDSTVEVVTFVRSPKKLVCRLRICSRMLRLVGGEWQVRRAVGVDQYSSLHQHMPSAVPSSFSDTSTPLKWSGLLCQQPVRDDIISIRS